jgi:hypothetical protein
MGDRALIICKNGTDVAPCALYLHWGGYKVGEILKAAAPRMRRGDTTYAMGRLIGVAHEMTDGGSLGLGVIGGPTDLEAGTLVEYSHGDAGVFVVDVATGEVACFGGYGFEDGASPSPLALSDA